VTNATRRSGTPPCVMCASLARVISLAAYRLDGGDALTPAPRFRIDAFDRREIFRKRATFRVGECRQWWPRYPAIPVHDADRCFESRNACLPQETVQSSEFRLLALCVLVVLGAAEIVKFVHEPGRDIRQRRKEACRYEPWGVPFPVEFCVYRKLDTTIMVVKAVVWRASSLLCRDLIFRYTQRSVIGVRVPA